MFAKNKNIKLKCKVDARINLCSYFNCCGFKKFVTIDKEGISDFLLRFNLSDCLKCSENKDNKNPKIEIKKLEE